MKYIFIGFILNSLVTSIHDNEEACKGREAMLRDKGVIGQCVKESITSSLTFSSGRTCVYSSGLSGPC